MKIKPITSLVILMTLGAISNALAGSGESALNFTLTANISQSGPENDVQIRLYNHSGNRILLPNLNLYLEGKIDSADNMVFGSTGNFRNAREYPEIAPNNIYVIEVYSENPAVMHQTVKFSTERIQLKNGTDNAHVIYGHTAIVEEDPSRIFYGPKNRVPDEALQAINQPGYFAMLSGTVGGGYTASLNPQAGYSLYLPISFFGHLPNWGKNIANYAPGNYSGTGTVNIAATW